MQLATAVAKKLIAIGDAMMVEESKSVPNWDFQTPKGILISIVSLKLQRLLKSVLWVSSIVASSTSVVVIPTIDTSTTFFTLRINQCFSELKIDTLWWFNSLLVPSFNKLIVSIIELLYHYKIAVQIVSVYSCTLVLLVLQAELNLFSLLQKQRLQFQPLKHIWK